MSLSGEKLAAELKPHLKVFALGWYTAIVECGSESAQSYSAIAPASVLKREAERFVAEHPDHRDGRYVVTVNVISDVIKDIRNEE